MITTKEQMAGEITENNMADPTQQVTAFMPEMQDITRQREMAKLLLQQGMNQNDMSGQMVSGRYVGASPWQGIAKLYQAYKGKQLSEEADKKQAELADLIRKGTAQDMLKFNELRYGSQGTPDVVPQGQTLRDDEDNLTYGAQQGVAPTQANPAQAYQFALQSRFPQVSGMATEMLKPQKLGEGERVVTFNPMTGKEEVVMQGADKYRAPISIDTGTGTVLLDPKTMQPIAKFDKASAGQVLETDNGPVLVDTRTGSTRPILANGQPVLSSKPLTEGQGKATAYGSRMVESDKIISGLETEGVTSGGKVRTAVSGALGIVPLVGENLQNKSYAGMNVLPGFLGGPSEQQQKYEQAKENFITANLRDESGATIGTPEYFREERKYFPQPGDSKAVIAQKAEARKIAIEAMKDKAGPGARKIKERQDFGQTPNVPKMDQSELAKSWLKANPNDPLAPQIRAKLQAEGKL